MSRLRPLSPLERGHLKNHLEECQGCWTGLVVLMYPEEYNAVINRRERFKKRVHVALSKVIPKHPILGVAIVDAETDPWFVRLPTVDLRRVVHVSDQSSYHYALYQGTNKYFNFKDSENPPWSVDIFDRLDGKERLGISVSIPLALGDGQSVKTILKDLIENLPEHNVLELTINAVPSEELLLPAYENRPERPWIPTLGSRIKEFFYGPVKYGRPVAAKNLWRGFEDKLSFDRVRPGDYQRGGIVENWDSVANAAKKHSVSTLAAVHAAVLFTITGMLRTPGSSIMTRVPVDLRTDENRKEIGNISGIFSRVWKAKGDLDGDFWTLAALFQQEFDGTSALDAAEALYRPTFNLGSYPGDYNTKWANSKEKARKDTQVTYATVADFGEFEVERSGGWSVNRVHISKSAALYNNLLGVTVATFRGTGTITVSWQQSTVGGQDLFEFHTKVAQRLLAEANA